MDQSKIGSFIMERRREKGLTQAQLAERLNITDRAVSKWETGKSLPDSSTMLELCGILECTVDELLNGTRRAGAAEQAALPPPPKAREARRGGRRRWWWAVLFSGGLFAGVLTCFLCDRALSGGLSWSLLVALSAGYGWELLFPLIARKRGGLTGSLVALSLFTVPYLYGLSRLLNMGAVFRVGTAMAAISLLFLWLAFAVLRRRGRTAAALGWICLLLAGLTAAVNGALYLLGVSPPPDAWNWAPVLLFLAVAAASFSWRRGGADR